MTQRPLVLSLLRLAKDGVSQLVDLQKKTFAA